MQSIEGSGKPTNGSPINRLSFQEGTVSPVELTKEQIAATRSKESLDPDILNLGPEFEKGSFVHSQSMTIRTDTEEEREQVPELYPSTELQSPQ